MSSDFITRCWSSPSAIACGRVQCSGSDRAVGRSRADRGGALRGGGGQREPCLHLRSSRHRQDRASRRCPRVGTVTWLRGAERNRDRAGARFPLRTRATAISGSTPMRASRNRRVRSIRSSPGALPRRQARALLVHSLRRRHSPLRRSAAGQQRDPHRAQAAAAALQPRAGRDAGGEDEAGGRHFGSIQRRTCGPAPAGPRPEQWTGLVFSR